jgi:arylsulfatase
VDGAEVARTTISHTVPFTYSVDETLDVIEDRGSPIAFKDTGRIDEVEIHRAGGNAALDVPDIDGK